MEQEWQKKKIQFARSDDHACWVNILQSNKFFMPNVANVNTTG